MCLINHRFIKVNETVQSEFLVIVFFWFFFFKGQLTDSGIHNWYWPTKFLEENAEKSIPDHNGIDIQKNQEFLSRK